MNQHVVVVPPDAPPQRLDRFLSEALPEMSRSRIQALIAAGHVTIAERQPRPARRVVSGERVVVHIPPPRPSHLVPEHHPLDMLYEDADLLVVNKPAGMVVHPAPGHATGTLVHALLGRLPDLAGIGGELRPGIVHRLDKDTSGVLVVAKNEPALRAVAAQLKERTIQKAYLALVVGHPEPPAGVVCAPVGRHPKWRKRMAVVPHGRDASTAYHTLEQLPGHAYLRVQPHTGRTHQIRVHLASVGHPIAGDPIYGRGAAPSRLTRLFLHAHQLTIQMPVSEQSATFEAPLPSDLATVLAALRAAQRPQVGRR